MKHLGNLFMLLALVGFLFTYAPIIFTELNYRFKKTIPFVIDNLVPKDPQFSLIVPKISASEKIIRDVDATSSSIYLDALKQGVAHAKGTKLPGEKGTVYLFSHSTDEPTNIFRFNAVFYLLKELEKNDDVFVFFENRRYQYRVFDKKIVSAWDSEYLEKVDGNKEVIILQTCFPPGTTWQRLLVFAERIN